MSGHTDSPPPMREQLAWLVKDKQRLEAEVERLREEFECESCEHNIFHHDGTRYGECDGDPEFGEFCTFIICGRCSNERAARTRRYRKALERIAAYSAWPVRVARAALDGDDNG